VLMYLTPNSGDLTYVIIPFSYFGVSGATNERPRKEAGNSFSISTFLPTIFDVTAENLGPKFPLLGEAIGRSLSRNLTKRSAYWNPFRYMTTNLIGDGSVPFFPDFHGEISVWKVPKPQWNGTELFHRTTDRLRIPFLYVYEYAI
jgi:hypothetical protein